jgi:hypothetical protein
MPPVLSRELDAWMRVAAADADMADSTALAHSQKGDSR